MYKLEIMWPDNTVRNMEIEETKEEVYKRLDRMFRQCPALYVRLYKDGVLIDTFCE